MFILSILHYILLGILIFWFIYFVRNSIKQIRDINKIREFREFTQYMTTIIHEIEDEKVKSELSNFLIFNLKRLHEPNYPDSKRDISKIINEIDLKEIKSEVYKKWGRHIPTLLQEQRENRINILLNKQ